MPDRRFAVVRIGSEGCLQKLVTRLHFPDIGRPSHGIRHRYQPRSSADLMDTISLPIDGANFFSSSEARAVLERDVLPELHARDSLVLAARPVTRGVSVSRGILAISKSETAARLLLATVEYPAGEPELYVIPIRIGLAKER